MHASPRVSRRHFLLTTGLAALAGPLGAEEAEPIIDIHQHTSYLARVDEDLIAHQRIMGVTTTVLLPAGSTVLRPSTLNGAANGLQAKCSGNEAVMKLAGEQPQFVFGANEVTDLDGAPAEIERYLQRGAKVIGEQKFGVECDSPESQRLYALAEKYHVPVLLHFQHGTYNYGIERFHEILARFPKVNFIGHAQTFWANIDAAYQDQTVLYPKGPVKPGGITDRLLTDFPNMYGDLSAGSGLGSLTRDEEHTRAFLERHQDQLMFGSDCPDVAGSGKECTGAQILAAIRRLAPSKAIERKILYGNAQRVFRL